MGETNFVQGIIALSYDIALFFQTLFSLSGIIGFGSGVIVAVLITGFILSKNPRHIPLILRYSSVESYRRIESRNQHHHYNHLFEEFLKVYIRIKILFYVSVIFFSGLVIFVAYFYRPE